MTHQYFCSRNGRRAVVNKKYGGFGLSDSAKLLWWVLYGEDLGPWSETNDWDIERDDPRLIATVEELGEAAGDEYSTLVIIDIPDHVRSWHLSEYDGFETIHEDHWNV